MKIPVCRDDLTLNYVNLTFLAKSVFVIPDKIFLFLTKGLLGRTL